MNISAKCNCCVCESVCRYKEIYQKGVESILSTPIRNYGPAGYADACGWLLKECPHIEVSIKCPHMITAEAMQKELIEVTK